MSENNIKDMLKDVVSEVANNAVDSVAKKVGSAIAPNSETPAPEVESVAEPASKPTAAPQASKTMPVAQAVVGAVLDGAKKEVKRRTVPIVAIVVAAIVVVAAAMLVVNPFQWSFGVKWGASGLKIEKTANVVEEVKKISEFTTACYYEERVLRADRDDRVTHKNLFNKSTEKSVHNEIVLTLKGTVRAGFNLSKLSDKDIVVSGDTLTINLPQPEIFDVISNPSDYKIFEEEGKWSHEEIVALQSEANIKTLNNALQRGILVKANKNAETRVAELFKIMGFKVVKVNLSDIPSAVEEPEVVVPEEPVVVEEPAAVDEEPVLEVVEE